MLRAEGWNCQTEGKGKISEMSGFYSFISIIQKRTLNIIIPSKMSSSSSFQELQEDEFTLPALSAAPLLLSSSFSHSSTQVGHPFSHHSTPSEVPIQDENTLLLEGLDLEITQLSPNTSKTQLPSPSEGTHSHPYPHFDLEKVTSPLSVLDETGPKEKGNKLATMSDPEKGLATEGLRKQKSILGHHQSLIGSHLDIIEERMVKTIVKEEGKKKKMKKCTTDVPPKRATFVLACQRNTQKMSEIDRNKESNRAGCSQKNNESFSNSAKTFDLPTCEQKQNKGSQIQEKSFEGRTGVDQEKENQGTKLKAEKESFVLACQRKTKLKCDEKKAKEKKISKEKQEQRKEDEKEHKKEDRSNFVLACQRKTKCEKGKISSQENHFLEGVKQEKQLSESPRNQEKPSAALPLKEFWASCQFRGEMGRCESGFSAEMVCVETNCDASAFICCDSGCGKCTKNHRSCSLKFTMEMFEKAVNKNLEKYEPIAEEIFSFGESIIEEVRQQRNRLSKYFCFQGARRFSFGENEVGGKKEFKLKSCDILGLLDSFRKKPQGEKEGFKLQILKSKLIEDKKEFDRSLNKELNFILNPLCLEESDIPSQLILDKGQRRFVLRQLSFPAELRLLFRASDNQFSIKEYHKFCDNQGHTFTVVKTEHGKLIGGYTPLPWQAKSKRDLSNSTFLLAIDLQQKLDHFRFGECSIHYDKDLGPCFGGFFERRDIEVFQEGGNLMCRTHFPNTFNWKRHFLPGQQSWRFLTGTKNGNQCRVLDFQVFQVRFQT